MPDTINLSVELPGEELDFVNKLLKSYEGLVFVTVVGIEAGIGRLELEVSAGNKDSLLTVLEDLQQRMELKIVNNS